MQHGMFVFHRHQVLTLLLKHWLGLITEAKFHFNSFPTMFRVGGLLLHLSFLAIYCFFVDWSSFNLSNKPELAKVQGFESSCQG
jgi:hypothetical protein